MGKSRSQGILSVQKSGNHDSTISMLLSLVVVKTTYSWRIWPKKICRFRQKYVVFAMKLTRLSVSAKTQTQTNRVHTHRWNGFVWLLWVVDGNSWAENTAFWNRKVYPLRTSLMPNLWLAVMFGKARKSKYECGKNTKKRTVFYLDQNFFYNGIFFT